MLTASDSENDLLFFHFFILDSAHDAMPYYDYCKTNGITPFIDLNWKYGRPPVYKDDSCFERQPKTIQ